LGITLVQYGFYLRGRALQDDDYYYDENINDKEVMARSAWLRFVFYIYLNNIYFISMLITHFS
jgi:hypothetical protein